MSSTKDTKETKPKQMNEGEGNRTAARTYNQEQQSFAHSGKVAPAAAKAKAALDGSEGEALRAAETKGRAKARE